MTKTELNSSHVRWLDFVHAADEELAELMSEFHFHPLDIADCKKRSEHPKVERYNEYVFLVFMIPLYNRRTREIERGEVDIFIGPGYLVTVSDPGLPPLSSLGASYAHDEALRERFGTSSIALLQEIIDRLVVSLYPMLDHVSLDIHGAEKEIFAGKEKHMVEEIALLRRNVTDFRRIVQSHKNTIKRLVEILDLSGLNQAPELNQAFYRTIDRSKEVWDLLESYRESTETIYETNESLISYKLNDIMRTFTTISVIIFFMTLIATLFSVRARGTPLIQTPFAFWILLAVIAGSGIAAHQFFKKRRLLE